MTMTSKKTQEGSQAAEALTQNKQEEFSFSEEPFDLLVFLNAKGVLIAASPSIEPVLGYTPVEIVGCPLSSFVHLDDQNALQQACGEIAHSPSKSLHGDYRLSRQDGSWRWFAGSSMNLLQVPGIEAIVVYLRAIPPGKFAPDKAVGKRFLHLAAIVESSDDAILSKDLDGIITSWNAAAEHMYGYSAQEIVGQPVSLLFAPDRQNEFTQIMTRIRQGERVDHYETRRVRKDGTLLTVSVAVSPVKDSTGTIIGASAIARDITEQKQLEAKFRRLFDSNLIGVFISDFAGTFLEANDAFLDVLGYTQAELQTRTLQRDALTPPEFHFLSQQAVQALQETGAVGPYEKEYLHKSGKRIPVLVAVTRIEQTETCIGFVLDMSERKELEKRKDEFISLASHELKTPVTSLKGFLGLMQRHLTARGEEKTLHYLARMDAQITRLTNLINDLLDLSKMQSGQLLYREEHIDIDALVQEMVEMVQGTTQTHQILLEGQPHALVVGDYERLGQVLTNLLNNAIKYSPQADKVLIRLAKDRKTIQVSVQDFGIGIAYKDQHKIFEHFYQATDEEEKIYHGLGIGLYISREIIKRHSGHLWVESKKGEGSTFYVTLPLAEEER